MSFLTEGFLLVGAILLVVSIFVSKLSFKFGVPTLLLFLMVGMLFGSDGVGIEFSNMKYAQAIGIVAMSIILFSGGMDTKFSDIKPVVVPGLVLSTLGVVLTAIITGLFIFLLSKSAIISITFTLPISILLASTASSTDSASVFSILRGQNIGLKNNLRPMLELESGSNDPVAYIMTITMIGAVTSGEGLSWNLAVNFIIQLLVGTLFGYLLGKLGVFVINKINLHNTSLYPILVLCLIFITYSTTYFLNGNGYLAVYIAGMVVGNHPLVKKLETNTFLDGLTWLFQIIMFLILGLLVNPRELLTIAPFAILVGIFMIVVARPLTVFLTLIPFKKIDVKSKLFISWVGLRGAVPILFATYPVIAEVENSHVIFNIVFFITIVSLIIQGTTIPFMAKKLDLDQEMEKVGNDFGIVFPEEIDSKLWDVEITENMLINGHRLMDMQLPKGILVIMIKRNDQYIIPNGDAEIHIGDKLLLVSAPEHDEPHVLQP
ncbi:MAG: potassium/proton antiporter [Bacteroidales bacterium]|nr:potassium/proton antiporter [Bacteroidales bacterium]MBO7763599.1 potassium/proton antiporter [Bacteroidales bacterium]